MLELILALFLGCGAGVITGLIPGIHTNTVAILIIGSLPILTKYFSFLNLGVFLISMVIMHSFVDFIPSIFLGAPEAETALGVLPGHKMLLAGEGYKALKLTTIGGLSAFLVGIALLPLFFLFLKKGYILMSAVIAPIILIASAYFIIIEKTFKKKVWALLVFLLSGMLGLLVLNNLAVREPLFPLLSGLFGTSTLIISMLGTSKITKQNLDTKINFSKFRILLNSIKAAFSSAIMSVLPALGAAQATVLAQSLTKGKTGEDFLMIVGGINTVSSMFVLTTLYLISRARTGVIAAMQQFLTLDFYSYLVLFAACIAAVGISVFLTLNLGKFLANKISKVNYRKLSIVIIVFISVLVAIFSGLFGLLVLSIATTIGLLAPKAGIKRIHAMGVLVLPVVFYFI